jgi:hypothetical protein
VYRDEDGKQKEVYTCTHYDEQNRAVFALILGEQQRQEQTGEAIEKLQQTPPTEEWEGQTSRI